MSLAFRSIRCLALISDRALRQTELMGPDRPSGPADAGSGSGGIEGFERLAPPRCEARRTSKKPETSSSILGPDHCRQIRRLYRSSFSRFLTLLFSLFLSLSLCFSFALDLPPATFVSVIIDRYIDLRWLLLEMLGHVWVSCRNRAETS